MNIRFLLVVTAPGALLTLAGCGGNVVVGGSGGSDGTGEPNGPGILHASCESPTPDPMPGLPAINTTPDGRPGFDLWRDVPCQGTDGTLCGSAGSASDCQSQYLCLQSDAAVGGVCTFGDSDTSCDGEGEVLGYGGGSCWLCAPIEAHAAACCAGLPGFDCREWPYPSNGKPGMVCARHDDCQAGLVCAAASYSLGYGICQCPGLSSDNVHPSGECGF